MTGHVGVVSPVTGILVCVCPYGGRASTVGETPSASVASVVCLGSAIAAFPTVRKVRVQKRKDQFTFHIMKHVGDTT